jgi:hypothetical protein
MAGTIDRHIGGSCFYAFLSKSGMKTLIYWNRREYFTKNQ